MKLVTCNPKSDRSKAMTAAIQKYARKHGYYSRTVRTMTVLRLAALKEAGIV